MAGGSDVYRTHPQFMLCSVLLLSLLCDVLNGVLSLDMHLAFVFSHHLRGHAFIYVTFGEYIACTQL